MTEDEARAKAWEELAPSERAKAIAEADAKRLWWGWCQNCHAKIEAMGSITRCPRCGAG